LRKKYNYHNVEFAVGYDYSLPCSENSIDIITMNYSLLQ